LTRVDAKPFAGLMPGARGSIAGPGGGGPGQRDRVTGYARSVALTSVSVCRLTIRKA
jgi:hypothetical protein